MKEVPHPPPPEVGNSNIPDNRGLRALVGRLFRRYPTGEEVVPKISSESGTGRFDIKRVLGIVGVKVLSGSARIKEHLSSVSENVTSGNISDKVIAHAPELTVGMVSGIVGRGAARWALTATGLSGMLPVAVGYAGVGALGGALSGLGKEYLRQRREDISIEASQDSSKIRAALKDELKRIRAADGTKLRNAALKGVAWGAFGGILGGTVIDVVQSGWIQEQISKLSEIRFQSPPMFIESTPKPGTLAFTPEPSPTPIVEQLPREPEIIGEPSIFQTPEVPVIADTTVLPDVVPLPAGSTIWEVVYQRLGVELHRDPTLSEVLVVTKEACRQSGISVPEWDLFEGTDHRRVWVGHLIQINNPVQQLIRTLPKAA